jgi:hypothetical protein
MVFPKEAIGLLHLLDALVDIMDDHHRHSALSLLFMTAFYQIGGAECEDNRDAGGENRHQQLLNPILFGSQLLAELGHSDLNVHFSVFSFKFSVLSFQLADECGCR